MTQSDEKQRTVATVQGERKDIILVSLSPTDVFRLLLVSRFSEQFYSNRQYLMIMYCRTHQRWNGLNSPLEFRNSPSCPRFSPGRFFNPCKRVSQMLTRVLTRFIFIRLELRISPRSTLHSLRRFAFMRYNSSVGSSTLESTMKAQTNETINKFDSLQKSLATQREMLDAIKKLDGQMSRVDNILKDFSITRQLLGTH